MISTSTYVFTAKTVIQKPLLETDDSHCDSMIREHAVFDEDVS
ncbi:hypothetical protein [Nitrosopumilus sp.]